uniref:Uncharacterized protein n=1 Tax=Pristionchus pacificus TaxID=54126 RepID=A0A2A6CTL0_PRIPA
RSSLGLRLCTCCYWLEKAVGAAFGRSDDERETEGPRRLPYPGWRAAACPPTVNFTMRQTVAWCGRGMGVIVEHGRVGTA